MKVLYFAELKELLQMESETINLSYDITVDQFKTDLFERHPEISQKHFQVAVNEEFVQDNDVVQSDDIIALIPPVSGG
ncbi:sulfur-carrier protein [Staphylococcus auricularis]|uniref:Molybdopterin synthase sulfur carrier subunit n=1 Tax=Staphylococcus auricularis TaxID=29379 RepID=A0AAP8TTD4_9STAP|nr:molybdopterin converting factor subunit 1 [Staphylococcus auricularis]MBM0867310.1 molybdopterin converting factor subunit 1 [Staphylococcus auricularis]MCG7341174.1 molybdopterin converting factor subunit 1 [Staphylococcus auricularis]MDC6327583.1 molybdopterin converting factor subunit 1 [Staphylococcus auricularis]MDN4533535.1 molybdopterin converting factor subunit 1 [Staphylococcus auricularis]PNZ68007.1 molybdopterin converting factor subunit 1 [Staphylococcus auricularis]